VASEGFEPELGIRKRTTNRWSFFFVWLVRDSNPFTHTYISIHNCAQARIPGQKTPLGTRWNNIQIHLETSAAAHKSAHGVLGFWTSLHCSHFIQTALDVCGFLETYTKPSCIRNKPNIKASGLSTPIRRGYPCLTKLLLKRP
jgi:hypothetical protein